MTVFLEKSQFDQFMQQFQALVTRVEALLLHLYLKMKKTMSLKMY